VNVLFPITSLPKKASFVVSGWQRKETSVLAPNVVMRCDKLFFGGALLGCLVLGVLLRARSRVGGATKTTNIKGKRKNYLTTRAPHLREFTAHERYVLYLF